MRAVVGEDIIITMMIMIIVRERDRGPDQDTEKTDMMTTREAEEETIPVILRMTMITEAVRSCLISPDINPSSTGFFFARRILLSKAARSTMSSGNTLPSIKLWPGKNWIKGRSREKENARTQIFSEFQTFPDPSTALDFS